VSIIFGIMKSWRRWHFWISWVSGIVAVASIVLGLFGFTERFDRRSDLKLAQAGVLLIWIVIPPLWFWFEYYFLYKKLGPSRPSMDEYKYGVEVSSKIWLALVSALLIMYFGENLTRDSSPPPSNAPRYYQARESQQGPPSVPSSSESVPTKR
jgi:hypothetical protein